MNKNINKNSIILDMTQTLTAVLQKEEDFYVASCPETGTTSQGKTVEEALANLKEATELYLEEFPQKKKPRPILTTFEVASVEPLVLASENILTEEWDNPENEKWDKV